MDARTFLSDHQEQMVDDLRAFVVRESPSTDRDRLHTFAGFLAEYARAAGGAVEMVESSGGNRHMRVEWGTAGSPPVLLLGHFDTVWPVGTLATMPFRIENGRAYGPGAFDMKAGLVQGFWAVRALREALKNDRRVLFLCTADEEVGSNSSRELIEAEAAGACAVLVLEPSQQGALKTARKGVANYWIEITGKASHAGIAPEAGRSAIVALAQVILALDRLADPAAGTTLNVGVVTGGTRSNVIAAHATADIDVRFSTQREADRISAAILGLQPQNEGIRLQVVGAINRPPMERTAAVAALFERARDLAAEFDLPLAETSVGGASDGNFCAALGVPVLDGLGAVGGGAHALDEHVVIDQMPLRAALVARLLASL